MELFTRGRRNTSTMIQSTCLPTRGTIILGGGRKLQEMYITHSLLSKDDWDVLAESAKWSRGNAATLADTHWIGGDPGKLEIYGWAAWSPEKGILTLRNPSDHPQSISLDVGRAFE